MIPDGGDEIEEPGVHVEVGCGGSVPGAGQLQRLHAEAVDSRGVLHVLLLHPLRHLQRESIHESRNRGS